MEEKATEGICLCDDKKKQTFQWDEGGDCRYCFELNIETFSVRKIKCSAIMDCAPKKKGTKKVSDDELINHLGTTLTKRELRAQRNIVFIDVTPKQQALIRKVLKDSFTPDEMELIGKEGLIVRISELSNRKSGFYQRKQKGVNTPEILLGPELSEDTITHEFVHHIRTVDPRRTKYTKTAHRTKNGLYDEAFFYANMLYIKNFEEAATVAETISRTVLPTEKPSGYYSLVPDIITKNAYESDRKRLTGNAQSVNINETKGIKGKVAVNLVNEVFPCTHIAAMRIANRTALEAYEILNSK